MINSLTKIVLAFILFFLQSDIHVKKKCKVGYKCKYGLLYATALIQPIAKIYDKDKHELIVPLLTCPPLGSYIRN